MRVGVPQKGAQGNDAAPHHDDHSDRDDGEPHRCRHELTQAHPRYTTMIAATKSARRYRETSRSTNEPSCKAGARLLGVLDTPTLVGTSGSHPSAVSVASRGLANVSAMRRLSRRTSWSRSGGTRSAVRYTRIQSSPPSTYHFGVPSQKTRECPGRTASEFSAHRAPSARTCSKNQGSSRN